jgi:hypothetical protein
MMNGYRLMVIQDPESGVAKEKAHAMAFKNRFLK